MMQLCRQFENACNQAYMQGHIRGFMHLDNGQETIPAFLGDSIKKGDIKYSYYREHTHAIASGVDSGAVMAELFAKDTGTCRGTGGSMVRALSIGASSSRVLAAAAACSLHVARVSCCGRRPSLTVADRR